ncbi:hypothetical protein [uncultured Phocaeicola sp.]|uniref:hypothetical protein n=1 Tax=uncultured Phocaeicola sp. TaxID=990718 RepID=UPI001559B9B8|nr:hypothetical protein [uncultured Phocaeicola sp.]
MFLVGYTSLPVVVGYPDFHRAGRPWRMRWTSRACTLDKLGLFAESVGPVGRTGRAGAPHLLDACKGITPFVRRVRLCPFVSV